MDDSAPHPVRRRGPRLLAASAVALALAAAETDARRRIERRTRASAVDVDVTGLSLLDVAWTGPRGALSVATLHAGPWTGGFRLRADGGRLELPAAAPQTAQRRTALPAQRAQRPDQPAPSAVDELRARLDRWGIAVGLALTNFEIDGSRRVPGARLHVHALTAERRPGGDLTVRAVARADAEAASGVDLRVRASGHERDGLAVEADAVRRGRRLFRLSGRIVGTNVAGRIDAAEGGHVAFAVDPPQAATLAFDGFAPKALAALVRSATDGRVALDGASFDGHVTVRRDGPDLRIEFEGLRVANVGIFDDRLAARPVRLSDLEVDGLVRAGPDTFEAAGTVRHGDAGFDVATTLAANTLTVDATLPPTPCQTLLDAAPEGLLPHLAGARFAGTLAGRVHAEIPLDRIGSAVEHAPALDDPPGVLDVDLPFPTACIMLEEPPGVDVSGLVGPYVHRFRGDDGRLRRRVLAPGERGFVPLAAARTVADALVTMEDTRFWEHDGFDRTQMQRAFWHNLLRGRIERGASTITQQLARNLWLGGRRTAARKLEEAVLAARLEQVVPKRRILEAYINVIELGPEVYGVADAARYHFGKAPGELDVLEALYLASLAPAPRTLSIAHHRDGIPPAWIERLREQARRMALHGFLPWKVARVAMRGTVRLRPAR